LDLNSPQTPIRIFRDKIILSKSHVITIGGSEDHSFLVTGNSLEEVMRGEFNHPVLLFCKKYKGFVCINPNIDNLNEDIVGKNDGDWMDEGNPSRVVVIKSVQPKGKPKVLTILKITFPFFCFI